MWDKHWVLQIFEVRVNRERCFVEESSQIKSWRKTQRDSSSFALIWFLTRNLLVFRNTCRFLSVICSLLSHPTTDVSASVRPTRTLQKSESKGFRIDARKMKMKSNNKVTSTWERPTRTRTEPPGFISLMPDLNLNPPNTSNNKSYPGIYLTLFGIDTQ